MKIRVLSDIHSEFFANELDTLEDLLKNKNNYDGLICAGDLLTFLNIKFVSHLFSFLSKEYPEIIYVTGNHEYYHSSFERTHFYLERECAVFPNLHWLNDSSIMLNGQHFIGCTLWFKRNPTTNAISSRLNDFRYIAKFKDNVYKINKQSIAYLKENVKENDIVITHHIPTLLNIPKKYENDQMNVFYVTNLIQIILDNKPKYWIHGHSHDSVKSIIKNTEVFSNPYGYYAVEQNPLFDSELFIEI